MFDYGFDKCFWWGRRLKIILFLESFVKVFNKKFVFGFKNRNSYQGGPRHVGQQFVGVSIDLDFFFQFALSSNEIPHMILTCPSRWLDCPNKFWAAQLPTWTEEFYIGSLISNLGSKLLEISICVDYACLFILDMHPCSNHACLDMAKLISACKFSSKHHNQYNLRGLQTASNVRWQPQNKTTQLINQQIADKELAAKSHLTCWSTNQSFASSKIMAALLSSSSTQYSFPFMPKHPVYNHLTFTSLLNSIPIFLQLKTKI